MAKKVLTQEERQERQDAMMETLKKGIQSMWESDNYRKYLAFYGKFHQYSLFNTAMILAQKPTATLCASFTDWKKRKRFVKKGAKGLMILRPNVHKYEKEIKDEDGNVLETKTFKYIKGFSPTYTFDIGDTEGEPVPEVAHELKGTVEDYENVKRKLVLVAPVPVRFDAMKGERAYGYFRSDTKEIVVKNTIPEVHQIKTLIHETAHSILHDRDNGKDKAVPQDIREMEAESVAFVVASYLGIDTSEYSFGYICTWGRDQSMETIRKYFDSIDKCAKEIINKFEEVN